MAYDRYVAIGDSSTEGLDDPDGRGGYRGWSCRLAERLALNHGPLHYANLGIRGCTAGEVHERQLAPALAMEPDLATLFVGTNDVLGRQFDAERFGCELEAMQKALIKRGARVVGFTLPDLSPIMPIARLLRRRIAALNAAYCEVSESTGATLVRFEGQEIASDPRFWGADRLHANSAGHERIAAALGEALGLPDCSDWNRPLPPLAPRSRLTVIAAEFVWASRSFAPWVYSQVRGRSISDGMVAKRPELALVEVEPPLVVEEVLERLGR